MMYGNILKEQQQHNGFSVATEWFSVATEWFSVATEWFSVATEWLSVAPEWFSVATEWFSVATWCMQNLNPCATMSAIQKGGGSY
jgi:hypothetical protein